MEALYKVHIASLVRWILVDLETMLKGLGGMTEVNIMSLVVRLARS